ncbi:MAG: trypsin-like peptidase domain-containing protein [Pseudomonadota bacterium]
MSRLTRLVRFLSPWIALGLAGALLAVFLRPALLPRRDAPLAGVPAQPAAIRPVLTALKTTPTATAPPASRASGYADAIARVAPAVVNISTRRVVVERRFPDLSSWFAPDSLGFRQREEVSRGSGVILDAAGHIATNYHVIKGVQEIVVQLVDGRSTKATLVGTDPETDIAILKIRLDHLPVMPLGRSDQLRVGDVVLAIGFPLGLGQTVTQGICSATGRSQLGLAMLENFIQTDAAINPGNSGGALVSTDGELVGINTAILSHEQGVEGIGFAIPVNLVRGVAAEIESKGRVARGWSGLGLYDLTDNEGRPVQGVEVAGFFPGSPGAQIGLRPGDRLAELDGQPITGRQDFLSRIARKAPGSNARLKGARPGAGAFETTMPVVVRPIER